jgi:hypothetical protein
MGEYDIDRSPPNNFVYDNPALLVPLIGVRYRGGREQAIDTINPKKPEAGQICLCNRDLSYVISINLRTGGKPDKVIQNLRHASNQQNRWQHFIVGFGPWI